MRSTIGQRVGFEQFYCGECRSYHPTYVAVRHDHWKHKTEDKGERRLPSGRKETDVG